MKNIDEEFNKYPHTLLLKLLFLPKVYLADSISDFNNNRNEINVTKRPTLHGLLYFNSAIIILPKCSFEKYEANYFETVGKLTDSYGDYLDVICNKERGLRKEQYYGLEDRMMLYEPWILFDKETKKIWLHRYKTHGPENFDSNEEMNRMSLKLSPSFI